MKLIRNTGSERVIDEIIVSISKASSISAASSEFSLFGFSTLSAELLRLNSCQLILPEWESICPGLLGTEADRSFRNRLDARWLAFKCSEWLDRQVELRTTDHPLPQSIIVVKSEKHGTTKVISGNCPLTSSGLGITPGNQFGLIQSTENSEEAATLSEWFARQWSALGETADKKQEFLKRLKSIASPQSASSAYHLSLYHAFRDLEEQLDEERVVKSATGIKDTAVWKKLFRFQRDGVIGAIDKLERHGGCIIADSVGLGKTFEALAIIKYYELRNDRVLVLVPKRLRDNWTLYCANDRRNSLASDRFHYDVLNHTDLSRDSGTSGDIDLAHINWGNYDLVVIDESHNFRNKATHNTHETRYGRLMRQIIKQGVKTRVLMLSATPVNNRLADLKNQIAFVTEGNDSALHEHGISSIEATLRQAQLQFNRWLGSESQQRTPSRLLDMLGFDYFKLLDLLTIARSRKHIEKYYGTQETGRFPERLKPINLKPDVDAAGEFRSIREINNEIRRLTLAAYAPLRYVLPHKAEAYDAKYSTQLQGREGFFRQVDREESLVNLLRVNVLKRMESAVFSFALTLERQLADVEAILARIDAKEDAVDELDIQELDIDDPDFESLLVGSKVKVLLQDVDCVRWRQDLTHDRNRLAALITAARQVGAARDAKLRALRDLIARKARQPFNSGNRKVLVFTAFADTAAYLYEQLAPWALEELGLHSALVTGIGHNQTTVPTLRRDFVSIITAFSPRSKECPPELISEGEIDLLIATDCVSEGQNLQDCDMVVNYDIHWNPVRIIQRFGRIDRLGSTNESIQLVNLWPNLELEEYINLERRVSGRMVLLDISATGEENVIEFQSGDQMNDLEYRRKQLLKLQDSNIDLEDLSTGVSIADLTFNDFRMDLGAYLRQNPRLLEQSPFGFYAVTSTVNNGDPVQPGVIFCLRAAGEAALKNIEPGYPLAPHYFVHVGDDGTVLLPYTQAKQVLDCLKRMSLGHDLPDDDAYARFDRATGHGCNMEHYQELLGQAIASIIGKKEERAVASLFTPGGTHGLAGEFPGMEDFEVLAFLVILPEGGSE